MIFQFGSIIQELEFNDLTETQEEKIVNGSITSKRTTYRQSIRVKNDSHALAEFLKLCDEHKAGNITSYGVQCYSDQDGKIVRIEKSWSV